jgi:hypothetical protein
MTRKEKYGYKKRIQEDKVEVDAMEQDVERRQRRKSERTK